MSKDRIDRTIDAKRQTTRKKAGRATPGDGEAVNQGASGHEASMSSSEPIGPPEQLDPLTMEVVLDKTNLQTALSRVMANNRVAQPAVGKSGIAEVVSGRPLTEHQPNRRMRTRLSGGVGGAEPRGSPPIPISSTAIASRPASDVRFHLRMRS